MSAPAPNAEWAATEKLLKPEMPALSPHVAHVLETESPLHAWTFHRLLGGKSKPTTDPQALGTILHNLFLENGDKIVELEYDSYRKDAAKEERDQALARGLLPCLSEKLSEANECVERWHDRLSSIRIDGKPFSLDDGRVEVPLEWTEDGVLCHGRADWIRNDGALIQDLKTTKASPAPDACAAALLRSAGVIQDLAYRNAVESEKLELVGRARMVFLFAQCVEPYAITPIACGQTMQEIATGRWRRARATWERCLRTNDWPSYATSPVTVEAPAWALHSEMNREEWV